eukprot:CAMPEP_0167743666 /NCGR_PEP_ID=MMETSP0110_2-20121227/2141_1 /TAXON_ID=629695 /ORGANISM="Gymnochlora sp., Strain CCMP2014" /LENGTH=513 /DNA_ID=CAMNT_0007628059 /DNA_START=180 /DNA_END=1718 /DNA_ORIENTATION=+
MKVSANRLFDASKRMSSLRQFKNLRENDKWRDTLRPRADKEENDKEEENDGDFPPMEDGIKQIQNLLSQIDIDGDFPEDFLANEPEMASTAVDVEVLDPNHKELSLGDVMKDETTELEEGTGVEYLNGMTEEEVENMWNFIQWEASNEPAPLVTGDAKMLKDKRKIDEMNFLEKEVRITADNMDKYMDDRREAGFFDEPDNFMESAAGWSESWIETADPETLKSLKIEPSERQKEKEADEDWEFEQGRNGQMFGLRPFGEGDIVPDYPQINRFNPLDLSVEVMAAKDFFKDKTYAVFGMYGAYYPIDSARAIPEILEWRNYMKKFGIDIAIISTSDPYTLHQWGRDLNLPQDIQLITDVNGELAGSIGVLKETDLGRRNDRYSMLVMNGTLIKLNHEDHELTQITGPGPLVQAYKRQWADVMNISAAYQQSVLEYATILHSSQLIDWHLEEIYEYDSLRRKTYDYIVENNLKKDPDPWAPFHHIAPPKLPDAAELFDREELAPTKNKDFLPYL